MLVSLRYLRSDGKLNAVVFSNVPLADGKRHSVLLRLSDLQRGSSKAELYVDCKQMDSIQDLPKAFSGLAQSSEAVELRMLQKKAQVSFCGGADTPFLSWQNASLTSWQSDCLTCAGTFRVMMGG